jgi:glutathione S-transferase
MKLYMNPVSTTCRPILLFAADNDIAMEHVVVDLMTGEHHKEPFVAVNPNRLVPVLVDGDLTLTESEAILRYLAEKTGSDAYPSDAKARAKVNEMLAWFNTNLYRELGYHLVYPQIFPHHKREPAAANEATVNWGKDKTAQVLAVLDQHYLGAGQKYLVGDSKTIADYFGAGLLACGELVGCDLSKYPNVKRWYENMKSAPSWNKVNEAHDGYAASLKGQQLVAL